MIHFILILDIQSSLKKNQTNIDIILKPDKPANTKYW